MCPGQSCLLEDSGRFPASCVTSKMVHPLSLLGITKPWYFGEIQEGMGLRWAPLTLIMFLDLRAQWETLPPFSSWSPEVNENVWVPDLLLLFPGG